MVDNLVDSETSKSVYPNDLDITEEQYIKLISESKRSELGTVVYNGKVYYVLGEK